MKNINMYQKTKDALRVMADQIEDRMNKGVEGYKTTNQMCMDMSDMMNCSDLSAELQQQLRAIWVSMRCANPETIVLVLRLLADTIIV